MTCHQNPGPDHIVFTYALHSNSQRALGQVGSKSGPAHCGILTQIFPLHNFISCLHKQDPLVTSHVAYSQPKNQNNVCLLSYWDCFSAILIIIESS